MKLKDNAEKLRAASRATTKARGADRAKVDAKLAKLQQAEELHASLLAEERQRLSVEVAKLRAEKERFHQQRREQEPELRAQCEAAGVPWAVPQLEPEPEAPQATGQDDDADSFVDSDTDDSADESVPQPAAAPKAPAPATAAPPPLQSQMPLNSDSSEEDEEQQQPAEGVPPQAAGVRRDRNDFFAGSMSQCAKSSVARRCL